MGREIQQEMFCKGLNKDFIRIYTLFEPNFYFIESY
jgi:hypothetical protein